MKEGFGVGWLANRRSFGANHPASAEATAGNLRVRHVRLVRPPRLERPTSWFAVQCRCLALASLVFRVCSSDQRPLIPRSGAN
jgi:hypothetical protein